MNSKKILAFSLSLAMLLCTNVYAADVVAADMGLLGPSALATDQDGALYAVDEKITIL